MSKNTKTPRILDDYLATLEQVKVQYQPYMEIGDLCRLPIQKTGKTMQYQPFCASDNRE